MQWTKGLPRPEKIEKVGGSDDLDRAEGYQGEEMFSISGHEEIDSSSEGAFEDAIIVIVSSDGANPLPSPSAMKNLVRIAPGKCESGNQNVGV